MSSSPTYLDPIVIPLVRGESILDVGCGYGRWGHLIQTNFWEFGLTKPPQVDGFDAFQPNVEFCSKSVCYRKVWHQKMPSPLNSSWDTVLACEFIEHVEQNVVEEVINLLEGAAKKRIIFSTPNWPYYRKGLESIVGYNDFEAHLSYTPRSFFKRRGYKLKGAGFGNPENLLVRAIKKSKLPGQSALESIPRIFPSLGEGIVAYKDF
ncbi:MAG: hypothetical protein A3C35_07285 [Omnitrophica bacterium RIFCSPHIGHO2_02_FULL_46_11]|nr:MAG: hypothetical protein A3C35_07285 [Omnitrophica bacterium RIFCSPHIGHO2_02_FULL_46_11]OGW87373.1 MAG: hypothetical protein A3A81_04605 [Omnitrophica bacterium RIFCSPLOWO2_01_FULL_45_10b]